MSSFFDRCPSGNRCSERTFCQFSHFTYCRKSIFCSDVKCQYNHPMDVYNGQVCPAAPPWPMTRIKFLCKRWESCDSGTCQFWHPPVCKFGPHCRTKETCKYSHPPYCEYGKKCNNSECTCLHPNNITSCPRSLSSTPCKYGDNCTKKQSCNFLHPSGNLVFVNGRKRFGSFLQSISPSKRKVNVNAIYRIHNKSVAEAYKKHTKNRLSCRTDGTDCSMVTTCSTHKWKIDDIGDLSGHEVLLFHGTSHSNVHSIINNGLRVQSCKRASFGTGIYFSEDINVSRGYSDGNSKGEFVVFIVRVFLGHSKGQVDNGKKACDCGTMLCSHATSYIGGFGASYREFVFYENEGCLPLYLLYISN